MGYRSRFAPGAKCLRVPAAPTHFAAGDIVVAVHGDLHCPRSVGGGCRVWMCSVIGVCVAVVPDERAVVAPEKRRVVGVEMRRHRLLAWKDAEDVCRGKWETGFASTASCARTRFRKFQPVGATRRWRRCRRRRGRWLEREPDRRRRGGGVGVGAGAGWCWCWCGGRRVGAGAGACREIWSGRRALLLHLLYGS